MSKTNYNYIESSAATTKHSSSMKLLPKIDASIKSKNFNEVFIMRQNLNPIVSNAKKTNIDSQRMQSLQIETPKNLNQFSMKRLSQQKIEQFSEESKGDNEQRNSLTKSQIRFKPSSQNKIIRNSSEIFSNNSQGSMSTIMNSQSPSIKQDMNKIISLNANLDSFGKTVKSQSPITQLQIDADQNRLDFMLEKGISFEKNSQLIKLKQETFQYRQENKKQENEIKRLKQEVELLKQQIIKLSQICQEKAVHPQAQEETFVFLEKKIQQNEYFKQQLQAQKNVHDNEITQLQEQILSMTSSLKQASQQIQFYQSHVCQPKVDQKEILLTQPDECKSCELKTHQINEQIIQIKVLQSDLITYKAQNENLVEESQSLRLWQDKTKEANKTEKSQYEKYIQNQSEEILKVDKQLRDYKKLYEDLNDKIKQIKNNSDFPKILIRNEYVLLKTEIVDNLERLNKERQDRINENAIQMQSLTSKYEEEKTRANKLSEDYNALNNHLEWLKKRGGQISKQNGTFNYIGLSEEILQLKKVIDSQITQIPNKEVLQNFSSQVDQMNMLNTQMVEKINKIQQNEEKTRKTVESIPILKQFDLAQTKVEYHLGCTKCKDILNEAITCVPCGHNYCKKCHYDKDSSQVKQIETDEEMPDVAISCMKCGPSTMIYRNESLDDIIEMYTLMKSSKEIMKAYLSQQ